MARKPSKPEAKVPAKPASKLQKMQIATATNKAKKTDKRGTPKGKATIKRAKGGAIGNPPHKPTADQRRMANDLSAYGIPQWAIAEMMGIGEDTLRRHYKTELAMGPHRLVARAANFVAKGVLAGDKDYIKFVLARRGGAAWANKEQTELSTPPGRPLETRDMSGLSIEELRILAKINARPSAGD